ncbi:TRAP transporter small permease [Chthonobacter albigriseus]|uniref:TRAP transporter small permease n=1 Tax=Chthonobacter albigriseus TaxID=1683161 RepID=UPI0015EF01A1|nr:TRAP transporter small permease [Chthonobacter albigriseus]
MAEEIHTPITAEELAHVFEEETAPVDLKPYAIEDWVTQALFWGMTLCVFLQFFTRYILNNSLAWTEEIAINLLVLVVFLGAVMCVRQSRHIQVDVLYHYLSPRSARILAIVVDVVRIAFFIYATILFWRYAAVVHRERMVTVNLPRNVIFYTIFAAFLLMLLRSIQVFIQNMRRGYSVLERPAAFDQIGS